MSDLATRVKLARTHAKLTTYQLADAVGCKQPTIAQIESGRIKTSSLIPRIAEATGVNVRWLDRGTGPVVADLTADEARQTEAFIAGLRRREP